MEFFDMLLNSPELLAQMSGQDVAAMPFGEVPGTAPGGVPTGQPAGAQPPLPGPAQPLPAPAPSPAAVGSQAVGAGVQGAGGGGSSFGMSPEMIKAMMAAMMGPGAAQRPAVAPSAGIPRPGAGPATTPPIRIGPLNAMQPQARRGY